MFEILFQHTCDPVSLLSVRQLREQIGARLQPHDIDPTTLNAIQVCFAEAANNVVEHSQPPAHYLHVELSRSPHRWRMRVENDGQYWDPTSKPTTDIHLPDDPKRFSERGRGFYLLNTLSSHLHYRRTSEGINCLTLEWQSEHAPLNASLTTKPKILLVEDNASQRRLLRAYLNEHYQIEEAMDGEQALHYLKAHSVDLVISDIRMPLMNGLDLKKALHDYADALLTPFIFLTSTHSDEVRTHAMNLGIDDFLLKPVSKTALLQSAQRVLQRSEQIYRQLTDRLNQRITHAFTPSLPDRTHYWQCAMVSRNTGAGGGDLVLHRTTPDFFMLNLVDIMGHDVGAKFFSYAYGGYLRGLMHHIENSPVPCETLLSQLSECALDDDLLSQVILTCCSVMLQPSGKITLACAGHPKPILITEQQTQFIEISGVLPGITPQAHYDAITLSLNTGERIALYTDGLFEAAETPLQRVELEQRVMQALAQTRSEPLQSATQHVIAVFDQFGQWHRDDATLILLEPLPEGESDQG